MRGADISRDTNLGNLVPYARLEVTIIPFFFWWQICDSNDSADDVEDSIRVYRTLDQLIWWETMLQDNLLWTADLDI